MTPNQDDDWDDVDEAINAYKKYKVAKAGAAAEAEKTAADARRASLEVEAWWRRAQQDIEIARKRAENEMELSRLERLSKLNAEMWVLAARTPEQARLVEAVHRTNVFKGLSPEKIIAMAAAQDPRFAEAFAPVLLRIVEAGKADEYKALMERLIGTMKDQSAQSREDYRKALDTLAGMFERFADTTTTVAQAAGGAQRVRTCSRGHVAESATQRFCMECGEPLT